jgi:glycyl-tRNA synthetase alpha chain
LIWQQHHDSQVTYGDVYKQFEIEHCHYNFNDASEARLFQLFEIYEAETNHCLDKKLAYPAYEYCLKCSHTFNLLDARGVVSVSERTAYILKIRTLARRCAETYLRSIGELEPVS